VLLLISCLLERKGGRGAPSPVGHDGGRQDAKNRGKEGSPSATQEERGNWPQLTNDNLNAREKKGDTSRVSSGRKERGGMKIHFTTMRKRNCTPRVNYLHHAIEREEGRPPIDFSQNTGIRRNSGRPNVLTGINERGEKRRGGELLTYPL